MPFLLIWMQNSRMHYQKKWKKVVCFNSFSNGNRPYKWRIDKKKTSPKFLSSLEKKISKVFFHIVIYIIFFLNTFALDCVAKSLPKLNFFLFGTAVNNSLFFTKGYSNSWAERFIWLFLGTHLCVSFFIFILFCNFVYLV